MALGKAGPFHYEQFLWRDSPWVNEGLGPKGDLDRDHRVVL